ncbi:MAG: site-2 protease family protein [Patescibacteria group bacterium]
MELIVFQIIVLIFSAVIHEISHGFMAEKLGDPTARLAGRLTLNPLKHLDPVGSVFLPLMLSLVPGGIVFGWAKPVPYNPYNLKNPERGAALIAVAGPLSNFGIAVVLSVVYRILGFVAGDTMFVFKELIGLIVIINIVLAVFNLIPIPPLDGAKVAAFLIPDSAGGFKRFFDERNPYGWIILIILIFTGLPFLGPIVSAIARFLLGI